MKTTIVAAIHDDATTLVLTVTHKKCEDAVERIRQEVKAWLTKTRKGKAANMYACYDFNWGDFYHFADDIVRGIPFIQKIEDGSDEAKVVDHDQRFMTDAEVDAFLGRE